MDTPVPGNVDEARKLAVFPRTDPAQAVSAHLPLPVIVQEAMTEAFSMQGVQLGVSERAAPRVIDHRATVRSDYGAQLLISQSGRAPCIQALAAARGPQISGPGGSRSRYRDRMPINLGPDAAAARQAASLFRVLTNPTGWPSLLTL